MKKKYQPGPRLFTITVSSFSKTFIKQRLCKALSAALLIGLSTQFSFGQCENVNTAAWDKRGADANTFVYFDGTQTRLADATNSNARLADATTAYYALALNTTPTIVPSASAAGAINVAVGQSQTISAIYRVPESDQWGVNWMMGWANSNTFNGAYYNGQADAAGNWAATVSIANQSGASVVYLGYTDPTQSYNGNTLTVYSSTATTPLPVLATGDSISLTLIPRTGGVTDLQLVIYRPSQKLLLIERTIQNVLNTASGGNGLIALYPTVEILSGAANMGCIKVTTQTQSSPGLPNSGTCGTGISAPWQAHTVDPDYKIYNDGTQTRLALITNNNVVTSSTNGGPNSYSQATVNQAAAHLSTGDTSSVSATFTHPNDNSWNQRWILGWAYTPSFSGASLNATATTVDLANWACNLYIQGSSLYYHSSGQATTTLYDALVPGEGMVDGDKIIGKLFPAVSGTGADLQVFVYRPSIDGIVFETYIYNILTTTAEANHDIYAAVTIVDGEVNLSCIGSGIAALSILPVKLISFTGTLQNENAQLQWQTAAEENMKYYEVFRSVDGINFVSIGKVNAYNNYATTNLYKFTDFDISALASKNIYYRVVAVNLDGSKDQSKTILIKQTGADNKISVYPNPSTGAIWFTSLQDVVAIKVCAYDGSLVKQYANIDASKLQYDLSALSNGNYAIRLIKKSGESTVVNVLLVK